MRQATMYHSHQYRQHAGPPLRLEEKARKSYRPKMSCHQCRFRKVKVRRIARLIRPPRSSFRTRRISCGPR